MLFFSSVRRGHGVHGDARLAESVAQCVGLSVFAAARGTYRRSLCAISGEKCGARFFG